MQRYLVSIEIGSCSLSLSEIAHILKLPAGPGSRSKGDDRPTEGKWDSTTFRIASTLPKHRPLPLHLGNVLGRLPVGRTAALRRSDRWATCSIHIAVIYTTYTVTVVLPKEYIAVAAKQGMDVEVSSYPGLPFDGKRRNHSKVEGGAPDNNQGRRKKVR